MNTTYLRYESASEKAKSNWGAIGFNLIERNIKILLDFLLTTLINQPTHDSKTRLAKLQFSFSCRSKWDTKRSDKNSETRRMENLKEMNLRWQRRQRKTKWSCPSPGTQIQNRKGQKTAPSRSIKGHDKKGKCLCNLI